MPKPLTPAQRDQLRADLQAAAARLDAGEVAPGQQANQPPNESPGLPCLYRLVAPDRPGRPVTLQAETVDPALWDDTGDPWMVLTAIAHGMRRSGGRPRVYGYALARPSRPYTSQIDSNDDTNNTPYSIVAVTRDGEVILGGTGSPGPRIRFIVDGLEQLLLAANHL